MLNSKKFLLTVCNIFLFSAFIFDLAVAQGTSTIKNNIIEHDDNHIVLILENTPKTKPLEEITVLDIVQNEEISPDFKDRIVQLLNKSQYEIDRYRTTINNHYKQVESKIYDFKKELNQIHNFKDDMEANLNLAKWMIISLSVGIICLVIIVVIMWKSVVNVNRNDVEVMYSNERLRKALKTQERRIELLEAMYKKDGKQE